MKQSSDEFYVGYLPRAPRALATFVKRSVIGVTAGTAVVALVLVFAQLPFSKGTFEFGTYRTYRGVVENEPYPTLRASDGQYLLVLPGKHGAESLARSYPNSTVEFRASRIERDGNTMIEVAPDSARVVAKETTYVSRITQLGAVTLSGEIVDSKCFLGVMNPGNGKVHRDCAARCISGGVPPAFIAKDARGTDAFMLLTGSRGEPLRREVLEFVAEPVRIHGVLERNGSTLILRIDPTQLRHGTE